MNKLHSLLFSVVIALLFSLASKAQDSLFNDLELNIKYVVDINGAGDFTKVQDAINAVPNNSASRTVVYIKNGSYYEKIYIPATKKNLVLIGQNVDSTMITYDDYSGKTVDYNTFNSETFKVDADDFWAINISIRNDSYTNPAGAVSQAPALYTNGDRQVFLHCYIWGFQDTYYSGSQYRVYFKDCLINGTVDYIFGEGTVLFDSCQIHTLRTGGYITAARTDAGNKFGYVFKNCRLTASVGLSGVYLGRPWGADARTVFFTSYEAKCINPLGWKEWNGRELTCLYYEYKCDGPGSDTSKRVSFGKQLSDTEAAEYTIENIFAKSNNPAVLPGDWLPNVDADSLYNIVKMHTVKYLDLYIIETSIQDIKVNGVSIPEFDRDTSLIGYELPTGTTDIPNVKVIPVNADSKVSVIYPKEIPGFATINVLAKYEASYRTIKFYLSVDNAFTNAFADSIYVNDGLIPDFDPNVFYYIVSVPQGTDKDMIVYAYKAVKDAQSSLTRPDNLPGQYFMKIIAPAGTANVYTIDVQYLTANNELNHNTLSPTFSNPVKDLLTVEMINNEFQPVSFNIYDLNGKPVKSMMVTNLIPGKNKFELDVSELSAGFYLCRMNCGDQYFSSKIIKE